MYDYLAPCVYRECDNKDMCKRYKDEDIPTAIQFQNMFIDGKCPYYIKIPTEVVKTDEEKDTK
jgi:hypothetical protein